MLEAEDVTGFKEVPGKNRVKSREKLKDKEGMRYNYKGIDNRTKKKTRDWTYTIKYQSLASTATRKKMGAVVMIRSCTPGCSQGVELKYKVPFF